jgi:hypothetical protein
VAQHLLAERAAISIYDPKVEREQIVHDFDEYKIMPEGVKFADLVRIETDPYKASRAIAAE